VRFLLQCTASVEAVTDADRVGEDQVMLMSREFEVVYEAPLRSEEFGEGAFTLAPLRQTPSEWC
jgi:hypothetical protein